jgi:hypothetical protein
VLLAEVVADELVASERARALGLDVGVGEVDTEREEARAEGEEGGRGEELPWSGRGAPPHPSGLVGGLLRENRERRRQPQEDEGRNEIGCCVLALSPNAQ